jgi:hypothetical protein
LSSSDSDFQFYLFLLLAIKQWETVAGRATFLGHFWAEIKAENVAISFACLPSYTLNLWQKPEAFYEIEAKQNK